MKNLQSSFAAELERLAESLRASTVHIQSGRRGSGSGVIWSTDGLIVTNAHVTGRRDARVELCDGRWFDGRTIATDERRDLAALRIDASNLPAVSHADSNSLRVGQLVVAMGNPLGISSALTTGIVHAIGDVGAARNGWIQADIDLAPGNSGGPLADVQGRVVGINSMVAGGLGLAVPSRAVQLFLADATAPALGITVEPVYLRNRQSVKEQHPPAGLLLIEVKPESAADESGLILGDVIVSVGGATFQDHRSLGMALRNVRARQPIELGVFRGGVLIRVIVGNTPQVGAISKEAA